MFNTNPQLNQQSTGAIPINSMYDTEKEREAMVPPPMTEAHEEAIKETLSEQIQESGYKDREREQEQEQQQPEKASPPQMKQPSFTALPQDDEEEEPPAKVEAAKPESVAELPIDSDPNEESKAPPVEQQSPQVPTEPSKPSIANASSKKGSQSNVAASQKSLAEVPQENMPADDYVPDEDEENYEMEEDVPEE